MRDEYQLVELIWQDRVIAVSYQANWLNTGQWHIELRCNEPLPVTSTGYRSQFVPQAWFANEYEIIAYVTDWLDTTAEEPAWVRYLEDSRQLKLF